MEIHLIAKQHLEHECWAYRKFVPSEGSTREDRRAGVELTGGQFCVTADFTIGTLGSGCTRYGAWASGNSSYLLSYREVFSSLLCIL